LKREAELRGVAQDRIVFAPFLGEAADHLARLSLADLFLDTLPYNAHAGGADALWAGVPILTCRGSTFAGRVGASLLNAVGLPELIAGSLADYEALALKLARDGERLLQLRAKLARNRANCPLFDTARFTRHLEAAFLAMWERHRQGKPPESFAVEPKAPS
jgi:protein O-GlcNAc transferase